MHNAAPNEASRLIAAYKHSVDGLRTAWTQAAFRSEIIGAVILTPVAFWVADSGVKLALLLGSMWLVMIVELLNTGIEKAIDRVSGEWHELSKQAKDLGSAAVLFSLACCATVWLCVLCL